MARKIRFPLEMEDGAQVRTMEELQEHFSLNRIKGYAKDGKLFTWLENCYMESAAEALRELSEENLEYDKKLCSLLGVDHRKVLLKAAADDEKYNAVLDKIAFTQEELQALLDKGEKEIYLCGKQFGIPADQENICYKGINGPKVVSLSGEEIMAEEKNITFERVSFGEGICPPKGAYQSGSYVFKLLSEKEQQKTIGQYRVLEGLFEPLSGIADNMGKEKFLSLAEKIDDKLRYTYPLGVIWVKETSSFRLSKQVYAVPQKGQVNTTLSLLLDYKDANDLAKKVMKTVTVSVGFFWEEICPEVLAEDKERAAKELIWNVKQHRVNPYSFLFWGITLLMADSTKKEETLSILSDFLTAMQVGASDLEEVFQVLWLAYREKPVKEIKNPLVKASFLPLLYKDKEALAQEIGKMKKEAGLVLPEPAPRPKTFIEA